MSEHTVKRTGRTRWFISSLLSSMIILNYFDRVAVSVAAPAIQDAFHLTGTELGIVFSIYTYSYTIMQIPAGSLLDRFGVAWVTRVGMVIWSLLTMSMAFFARKTSSLYCPIFNRNNECFCISGSIKSYVAMVSSK